SVPEAAVIHEAVKGDGCDILWRIEQLAFADVTLSVAAATGAPAVTTSPSAAAGVAFGRVVTGVASAARTGTGWSTGNGPRVGGARCAGRSRRRRSVRAAGRCLSPITPPAVPRGALR